jgi:hypothetical protein
VRDVSLSFDTREIREVFATAPRIINQHLNDGMRKVGAAFSRELAKTRLTKAGGFQVRSKREPRPTKKRQPRTSKKFRRAGFRASLAGQGVGKTTELFIAARNPLLIQREEGATLQGAMLIPQTKKGAAKKGAFRRASRVVIPATLGFARAWAQFAPRAGFPILEKEIGRAFDRIAKAREKGRRVQ